MEKLVVGIDEVGRGPLLGPVAVGICVIVESEYERIKEGGFFWAGKDSKKLTEKRRAESFVKMAELKTEGRLAYGVYFEDNTSIDELGIIVCLQNAIRRGLSELVPDPLSARVLLDGGLRAPRAYSDQTTIIRGDETELVISLASIAAKVTRDAKLVELSAAIPHYDLKNNKGYGTAKHLADLKQFGPCPFHRRSFLKRLT